MKVFFILLILNCGSLCQGKTLSSQAIESILSKYFSRQGNGVDIVHFGNNSGPGVDIITKLLRIEPIFPCNLTLIYSFNETTEFKMPTIAIFDSVEIFKRFNESIYWQTKPLYRLKHLVYIHNSSSNDIIENIQDGFTFDSVNFLTNESNDSIDLMSLFMFTEEKCRTM